MTRPLLAMSDATVICVLSVLYALIEIEIEGKHGWCARLPTAKRVIGRYSLYHVYFMTFMAVVIGAMYIPRVAVACAKSPLTDGGGVTAWQSVARFVFFLVLFFLLEDVLWFVFNPYYTLARYSRDHVPWHGDAWIHKRLPTHNIIGLLVLLAIALIEGTGDLMYSVVVAMGFFAVSVALSPTYHKLYKRLHFRDSLTE